MKFVVIGGTGLIGGQVAGLLREQGHEVVAASPSTGVNALTGEGVAQALTGADVVVDVSNSPSFADDAVLEFFTTSTGVLLKAEEEAGVRHHVALSIVGADRIPGSGYMRAKVAQEELISASSVAHSVVRATQFFEFAPAIAQMSTDDEGAVRLPTHGIQPIASAEVARIVAGVAVGEPLNGVVDIAGPQRYGLDEFVRLAVPGADVVTDPEGTYAGTKITSDSLVPLGEAIVSEVSLPQWQATR
ncbi:SDR family oxidoreductase [Kineosporia sp. J2-2]|uniref:SDR family oxidoreductase n=1 Tax=Kineosporia corallincola TaxID=2835133 RepID=A0ABS5TQX4_9ACTN|nr:SDR family oxidoreductase [Kineosporia corallincola]MBT0773129.1 SDR family oxidoreductase [Kineosporia corallincola]